MIVPVVGIVPVVVVEFEVSTCHRYSLTAKIARALDST